jgi:methyl halide transferase
MDWNQRYIENDTPWDHGEAAPPLVEFLQAHSFKGDIIVPGCGRGHDVRLLAKHGANATGIDISPTAIKEARSIHTTTNETYEVHDIFKLPHSFKNKFDGIFEHTCFCTLQPELRADYVQVMHQMLKKNGKLLAIFFTYVKDEAPGKPPMSTSTNELDKLFNPYFDLLERVFPSKIFASRSDCKEEIRLMVARK